MPERGAFVVRVAGRAHRLLGTSGAVRRAAAGARVGAVTLGKPLRVLIAENHPDLSEAVARILDSEPDLECVGQVANVAEVLQRALDTSADAVILDLSLHGGSSMQLIEELAHAVPGLRIVVFSGLANAEEAARETKRRGAAEFVSKGCDINVLLSALRSGGAAAA